MVSAPFCRRIASARLRHFAASQPEPSAKALKDWLKSRLNLAILNIRV